MSPRHSFKNPTGRRLAAYLAAGAGVLAMPGTAEGTTITTNGPFSTGSNGFVDIDFDGINGPEFRITHATGTGTFGAKGTSFNRLLLSPRGGATGQAFVKVGYPSFGAAALTTSANVGGTLTPPVSWAPPWNALASTGLRSIGNFFPSGNPFAKGNFLAPTTAYLGVQFTLTGNAFRTYGWIELTTYANQQADILRYAYDDSGAPVHVGTAAAEIPEPNSLLLLASGAAGLLALRRRRNRKGSGQ